MDQKISGPPIAYFAAFLNRIPRDPVRLTAFWAGVYGLLIVQDLVYSVIRITGFYWSEVTLFNGYWLLFIPSLLLLSKVSIPLRRTGHSLTARTLVLAAVSLLSSGAHLLIFSALLAGLSQVLFAPAHPFLGILLSSLSNDFALTSLGYFLFLSAVHRPPAAEPTRPPVQPPATFTVKLGNRLITLDTDAVYYFRSSKPYTALHTATHTYLLPQSLSALEQQLDPQQFVRIHRTTIVRADYVRELISRRNGDYDAVLPNGQTLRVSRHYRQRWGKRLGSST